MNRDKCCVLCGVESNEVSVALIAWRQPVGSSWFTAAPRCRDHVACRSRVELHGEPWDVREREISAKELVR